MKFSEAMEAMQGGSKVTRKEWLGSVYFQIEGSDVKSYQPKITLYVYNEDIMISDGWIVEGMEGEHKFYDIIQSLYYGKKAKLKDWNNSYIQYDVSSKSLIIHTMDVFPYSPNFDAFMATDWMTLE